MTIAKPKTKKKNNLKRTTIFLTEEHREALRRIAFERRTSMANLIREAALEVIEDDEDIREVLKAREEGGEYISWEDYKRERMEQETGHGLPRKG